jgi:hypothetical protein
MLSHQTWDDPVIARHVKWGGKRGGGRGARRDVRRSRRVDLAPVVSHAYEDETSLAAGLAHMAAPMISEKDS